MRNLIAPIAIVALLAPAPAFAQASRETLADAVASAVQNNPSLNAQRKSRAGADELLEQAKAAGRPTLGIQGSYGAQNQSLGRTFSLFGQQFPLDGRTDRSSLGLEARQPLYAGGTLGAQKRAAEQGVASAAARLTGFEQQVILETVSAFLDVRRAEAEVEIRETNVTALRQQVQAATDRFNVGDVTRTDVAQAQSREAGSEGELAAAKARLAQARAQYEQIVGHQPVQLAEPPPPAQLPGSIEAAQAIASTESPAVIAAKAAEKQAEESVDIAKGALRPKIGLSANAGIQETYQDRSFRDTNVGVTADITIPLYQGGLLASKTRGAKLEADRLRYERMATERQVTAQVSSAWAALIAAREATTASQSRVTAAQTALEGAQQELAVGTRITLDVLDQERELLDARLGLIDSQRAAYLAAHQLLAAIGRLKSDQFAR
jgi:outer membrane protein